MSASHEASTDGSDSASEGEVDDEDVSILTTPGTSQTPIQRHFIPEPKVKYGNTLHLKQMGIT